MTKTSKKLTDKLTGTEKIQEDLLPLTVAINDPILDPRNSRLHPEENLDQIKLSLLRYGQCKPVVVNKRTGIIVAGNGLVLAARELGWKRIAVARVELTDNDALAYSIMDNKSGLSSTWNLPNLKDVLQDLDTGEFDMKYTGFSEAEIEELMTQTFQPIEGQTDDDAVPDEVPTICKTGDLWQLGEHRLLCGDATKREDVERLMQGEKADMVFTDPPYNVQTTYGEYKDNKGEKEYSDFSLEWLNIAQSLSPIVLFTSGLGRGMGMPNLQMWYKIAPPHWMLIWVKKNALQHSSLQGFNNWEPILLYGKPKKKIAQDIYDIPITVQKDVADGKGKKLHPTPKQVKLWVSVIEDYTNIKAILYEPFGGSGTCLIACEKLQRKCRMMEIDEHYCDVIIKRWEDYTGQKAVKL